MQNLLESGAGVMLINTEVRNGVIERIARQLGSFHQTWSTSLFTEEEP